MALIFSPSIASAYMNFFLPRGGKSISIFSNAVAQPSAATLISNWASYKTSTGVALASGNFNFGWLQPYSLLGINDPGPITPFNTGTAAWAVIWENNNWSTGASLDSSLPTTSFMIVPVSGPTGNGVVRLSTASLVAGQQAMIVDVTFTGAMV